MKKPTTRGFLRGVLLLSLSAGRVGCFIVCGAGRPRSTAHQLRPPSSSCCVDRPLQTHQPQSREAGDTTMVLGGERRLVERARSERANCLRQGVRLLAAAEAGEQGVVKERASPENTGGATAVKITEEEVERNYTPKEREFVDSFLVEFEAAEEPQADEDDLAVYSNDYKMYAGGGAESLNIEWDAAMGKADHWDLPPFEDFDPKVPPVHYKYYEDDLQANLRSEVNPFPLHSEWVDRDIKVGDIDEAKKEAIEPMMSVIEQVCTLIDTTDDVFYFKYVGPIRHKKGIASWAMVLIKRLYPEVKGVEFVTNRTRDRTDW